MVYLYCVMLATISTPWNTGLSSPMRLQLCKVELQSSVGLPGAAELASKMAHSSGCWQGASVPSHTLLSMELHEFLMKGH